MDRRSWPWKRRSIEKSLVLPSSTDSSPAHSARLNHEQDLQRVLAEHARSSDEATSQWHQTEEKVRELNEKLSSALADIAAKDKLVEQHVKVAEEAVSGWEKAEAETVAVKNELDMAIQQKITLNTQVAHIDGALKECMRELRHVRQEQEDKIHEAIIKKTREWEKVRLDYEAKLSDLSHQLLDARAEKNVLVKSVQDRTIALSGLEDAKSTAEALTKGLQARIEMLEKENSSMKFDMHVLNKEICIRNDERDYTRKAADAANKQHLESVKQIAKLEAECQRLRMLLRKKLPGPAALAQMKLESEALGKGGGEKNKKPSPVKKDASSRQHGVQKAAEAKSQAGNKDSDILSDRSSSLEDECRILKENLERKERELQSARQMCAKTASRLSKAEEQLEATKAGPYSSPMMSGRENVPTVVSRSEKSINGDPLSSADAWASALIAELSNLKDKSPGSLKGDLMDDFAEMERLASTVPTSPNPQTSIDVQAPETFQNGFNKVSLFTQHKIDSLEDSLSMREKELEEARRNCLDLNRKLLAAEEKIASFHSRNAANEESLIKLQEKIDTMLEEQNQHIMIGYEGLSEAQAVADALTETASRTSQQKFQFQQSNKSVKSPFEPSCFSSTVEPKSAVCKIIRLVVALVQETGAGHGPSPQNHSPTKGRNEEKSEITKDPVIIDEELVFWLHRGDEKLNPKIRKLVYSSNELLKGTVDAFSFIAELSVVLECVVALVCCRTCELIQNNLKQSISGYRVEELEEETKNMLTPLRADEKTSALRDESQSPNIPKLDDDARLCRSCSHSKIYECVEEEVAHLKISKSEIENDLDLAHEKINHLKTQLIEQEHVISSLHMQLGSAERSRELAENNLTAMASLKANLESQIKRATEGENRLQERLEGLKSEFESERIIYLDAAAQINNLQQQLDDANQLISTLHVQFGSTQRARQSAEDQIEAMSSSKSLLESHIKAREMEVDQLHGKIVTLESELHKEQQHSLKVEKECHNLQGRLSDGGKQNSELKLQLSSAKEEKQLAQDLLATCKARLESQIKALEVENDWLRKKMAELQSEIESEKNHHEKEELKLQNLEQQLSQTEKLVSELQSQLASTQHSVQLAEDKVANMASSNEKLQSQFKVANSEVHHLQERVATLQFEIQQERRCHETEMATMQNQLRLSSIKCSQNDSLDRSSTGEVDNGTLLSLFAEETRASKVQEVAAATEKLAECQHTIALLRKQLRALSSANSFEENDHVLGSLVCWTTEFSDLQFEDPHFQVKNPENEASSRGSSQPNRETMEKLDHTFLLSSKNMQPKLVEEGIAASGIQLEDSISPFSIRRLC